MKTPSSSPSTIDEYIAMYPPKVRTILERVRQTIRKAAPDAEERISYRPLVALPSRRGT